MLIGLSRVGLGLAALAAGLGYERWRHGRARELVERWAREHRYRLRRCERRWLTFAPAVPPSWPWVPRERFVGPIVFRVVVDDLTLGGSHTADVRCWVRWFGLAHDELEVEWVALGAGAARAAGPGSWEDAQLALIHRVAAGKTTFQPERPHDAEAGRAFDELVEHLLALRRRRFLSFPDPAPARTLGGGRYAEVRDVALTEEGRRVATRGGG